MQFPTILLAAGLAAALPSSPSSSSSKAFSLRTNLLDSTRDLTPSIQNYYLTTQRTGAGTAISIFTHAANEAIWYQNSTTTPTVVFDVPGVYPLSLAVGGRETSDPLYPGEHAVGASAAGAAAADALHAGTGRLSTLSPADGYVVCDRDVLLGGVKAPIRTVRYVYSGESVPADCAPVEFVAECAALPDLPADSNWDHESAVQVPCSVAQ